jgi:hypothetical protein
MLREGAGRGGEFAAFQAAENSRHSPLKNLHRFASRRIAAKGRGDGKGG